MAKSGKEIETEILQKWTTRRLRAMGMWHLIRHQIEQYGQKRPGFLLHDDGQPMRTEGLAKHAKTSVTIAEDLIEQLSSVGLISVAADGAIYSPILARLERAKESNATKQRRHRERSGLRNPKEGVTSTQRNPDVTSNSPPDGFSLSHSLSSLSPPPEELAAKAEAAAEEKQRNAARAEANRLSMARSFAVAWISAECPNHLRDGSRSFTNLIVTVGKEKAIEIVKTTMLDGTVLNPFAVAWENHDPSRRIQNRNPSTAGRGGWRQPLVPRSAASVREDN